MLPAIAMFLLGLLVIAGGGMLLWIGGEYLYAGLQARGAADGGGLFYGIVVGLAAAVPGVVICMAGVLLCRVAVLRVTSVAVAGSEVETDR